MCLLYSVSLRVGCVECYTETEGYVCVLWWKKANLTCLNRLNVAWVELHSETVFRMRTVNGGKFLVY